MLCVRTVVMVLKTVMTIRTYTELSKLNTFEERFEYLKLQGVVGRPTFGYHRRLNQLLYSSPRWKRARDEVIIRDEGCDLSIPGYDIHDKIYVHHMNPITLADVEQDRDYIYDPEYLICTSTSSHNAIHYSDISIIPKLPEERVAGDTTPWLKT